MLLEQVVLAQLRKAVIPDYVSTEDDGGDGDGDGEVSERNAEVSMIYGLIQGQLREKISQVGDGDGDGGGGGGRDGQVNGDGDGGGGDGDGDFDDSGGIDG